MRQTLSREHRKMLETTVAAARAAAEEGAEKALKALGVGAKEVPAHESYVQKKLRVRLRAHGRALGDLLRPDDTQTIDHLVAEVAYEHWHRMLFARFLAENDLLMHPDGYPVSLADCKEDAADFDPPARSEWEVAGHYAARMLPNIFRPDSPALALQLPPETEQTLEALLARLPATVFQADDSLGWSYQFWQAPKKEAVQRQMKQAGTKVGADELPAVTQLFTEHYMVAFLLENALGGWWLGRHPGTPLPVAMPYLRTLQDGKPAAGTFPDWPDTLADFRLLDPCAGSGHFLVSAFHYLVPLRCASEKLSVRDAVDRVLAENLYGLEIDPRCVEIAAFALALAAWRMPDEQGKPLGVRPLPRLNIACVGLAPRSRKADWLKLAAGDEGLERGMETLYALFQKAPELGSLIDPMLATRGGLFDAPWEELEKRLGQALTDSADEVEAEARVAAQGMAHAARILTRTYHLVITNPPYLGAGQHGPVLKDFCEAHYKTAKGDLANVFLERSLKLCAPGGAVSFVMPQNWLFLKSYQKQREHLLRTATWNLLARLGEHGFDSADAAGAFTILLTLTRAQPANDHPFHGLDASAPKTPEEKATQLLRDDMFSVSQSSQISNPDSRVSLERQASGKLLAQYGASLQGVKTGDDARLKRYNWEIQKNSSRWKLAQGGSAEDDAEGYLCRLDWSGNGKEMARLQGLAAIGKRGIALSTIRKIVPFDYLGAPFTSEIAVIVPANPQHLPAIRAYCESPEYAAAVRAIDQKVAVTNATLAKVPFDLEYWQQVAAERYPNGLPKPYSNDPTQWIFHGHPCGSVIWDEEKKWTAQGPLRTDATVLQVAVARLLGYRWPAETDSEMELADEARAWVARCREFDDLVDDDGIVCLPPVRGEAAAETRLRALLARAYDSEWSAAREAQLLAEAGCEGMTLAQWLRDKFFEQHVALFHKRPFIWHIWDGHKEGFAALVNYHLLTREKLNTLINVYLGDWITQQKRAVDAGNAEAALKLAKAEALKGQLEKILEGEAPYDIFVRWKPLHQQPLGWDPDLNDGVRVNIRPFVEAGVLRIPRAKLGIKWTPDRGKDLPSAPWYTLGPRYGEPEGTRINDHHTTLAEKKAAREKARGSS
jgi:hypothetical protein